MHEPGTTGEPSPKFHVQLNTGVPPVMKGTKVVLPTMVSLGAKSTARWVATVTLIDAVAEAPFASVTVSVTVNAPDGLYACWTGLPEPAGELSPKFQLKE